jgi:putative membrane protein
MKKAIIITLLSLGGLAVKAQTTSADTAATHFLAASSIGNLQEISAARIAEQKSKLADVRSFARMMVKDHGEAQQRLIALAKSKGYNLPEAATGGIKPDPALVKAKDSFDKLYVHAMVVNHTSTVKKFENYAITGKDPDVRAFAQQTLPVLKEHLAAIKAIDNHLKNEQLTYSAN